MKRAKFFEKWLEYLESGKHRQIQGRLRKEDGRGGVGYCCLGLACVVANETGARRVDEDVFKYNELLPGNMETLLGISSDGAFLEPVKHNGRYYRSLADLNDGGVRFKTIARIIREQLAAGNFEKP